VVTEASEIEKEKGKKSLGGGKKLTKSFFIDDDGRRRVKKTFHSKNTERERLKD